MSSTLVAVLSAAEELELQPQVVAAVCAAAVLAVLFAVWRIVVGCAVASSIVR
ncbi:hypothetical protein BC830DRAFT_1234438 [Chytriomyces sp. MP71]|nr:hypothetical protein BC830DRAFT_1234438 [Chytriomyces sp. MP71]